MKKFIIILGIAIVGIAVLVASNYLVTEFVFGPPKEVRAALRSDSLVTVGFSEKQTRLTFSPAIEKTTTGLIMYPENYQDIRMYAPICREIAKAGYDVIMLSRRGKFPLSVDEEVVRIQSVMSSHPEVNHWFIGAHSWEAFVPINYALKYPETIKGLIFWGARIYADSSLEKSSLPILMVYGTNDDVHVNLLATDKPNLPPQTQWVEIQGGNRVNFANFGPLPGDTASSISIIDQQDQTVKSTVEFISSLVK